MAEKAEKDNKTLVGVTELAKLFGLSDRRIQQLTANGTIEAELVNVGGRSVRNYDLLPTVHKYVTYLQDRVSRRGHSDKEMKLKEQKLEAEIALKESQGELHKLKTQIASGEYISIEQVAIDYERFFTTFKKFAMSIPPKAVGMIASKIDSAETRRLEQEMTDEVARLLKSFIVAGVEDGKNENVEKKV